MLGHAVLEALESRRLLSGYTLNALASFDATSGSNPQGGIIMDASGNLYGTAEAGGDLGNGTVFEMSAGATFITQLASFNSPYNGALPEGRVSLDAAGNLYGTTANGGSANVGTVWELANGSGSINPLATFDGQSAAASFSGVVADSDGNLFGTTVDGGDNTVGAVFELSQQSGSITTLVSGDSSVSALGSDLIMDSAGNLYGASMQGGVNTVGSVFELAKGSSTFTVLASFNTADGAAPEAGLIMDGEGNLFGTTADGGTLGDGVVYEVVKGSGVVTKLATFDGANGSHPDAPLLMDAAGNLYGSTANGGDANGDGTLFKVASGSGTITTLAEFDATDGSQPSGALAMDAAGNIYGAADNGGTGTGGTIFELSLVAGAASKLAFGKPLTNAAGTLNHVVQVVVEDSSGNIDAGNSTTVTLSLTAGPPSTTLGGTLTAAAVNGVASFTDLTLNEAGSYTVTATDGSLNAASTNFTVTSSTSGYGLTAIAQFDGNNGTDPQSPLLLDASGNLYGTASSGGLATGDGTLFEVPQGSGAINAVAQFDFSTSGANPIGGALIQDASGNLYGTASTGDISGFGSLYELPSGAAAVTPLASFNTPQGATPSGSLVMDGNGFIYGTTSAGGANNEGAIYAYLGSDGLDSTYSFDGTNGELPEGGVIADPSGDLFGTTRYGGVNNVGTVFKVPESGEGNIVTLASFNTVDGSEPFSALLMDSSGNLYGTTFDGGADGDGTVFEIAQGSSVITTLASFNGANGANPIYGPLLMDAVGNLYGTSSTGGDESEGTVFEIAKDSGVITTLASLNGLDGSTPTAGLIADAAGNLYGTASNGGNVHGTVFELSPDTAMPPAPNPPTQLQFTAPPTMAVAGATLTPAVTVSVEDAGGTVDGTDTSLVTLSIESGPSGATLGGTVSVMDLSGVATFGNLSLNEAGTYTLKATDGTLAPAMSTLFTITPPPIAPAAQLAFASPSSVANAGAVLNPPVAVSVEDASGNVVVTDTSTVTLTIASGPVGAVLGGTVSATAVNGVATFANLSLNEAGNYTLQATDGTLTAATSVSFTITPAPAGSAAQLVFAAPPSTTTVNAILNPAVAVNVEDAGGNIVVADNSTVTLAIASGPAGAILGGTVSAMAVNGVATFSNLSLNEIGAYTLTATDGSLAPVTTASFSVMAPPLLPASRLVFTAMPATAVAGANLSPAVAVSVEDANGNLIATDNSTVTVSIASGPAGAVLGGALTASAVNGVAAFSNLIFSLPGDYTLLATDGLLTAATSTALTTFAPAKIGALDPTFGVGGRATHNVGLTSTAGLVVEGDGKSIIAGTTGAGSFGITRYNADGTLDTTFGTNGVAMTPLPGDVQATAEALLSNGDILIAGTDTTLVNGQATGSQFALVEYTSAGALDPTFGNGAGYVLTSFSATSSTLSNDVAHALVIGPDGTIYLGGSSDANGHGLDFAVAAYASSGSPSPAFGTNGKVLLDFMGGNDSIAALAIGSKGELIAAGSATNSSTGVSSVAMAEFLASGALDTKFGVKGEVITSVGGVADAASAIAIGAKGAIVVGGYSATGSASAGTLSANFLLLRYESTGKLDKTFGHGGIVTTSFNQPAAISSVLIDSDGTIVASGKTISSLSALNGSNLDLAVARYTTKGQLDTTFDGTGEAIFSLAGAPTPQSLIASGGETEQPDFMQSDLLVSFDAMSDLMTAFMQLTQSDQGVIAMTSGGELLDVGNSGNDTVEAAIVTTGLDLTASLMAALPQSVIGGGKGATVVTVGEAGTELAAGTFTVELFASNTPYVATGQTPFQSFPEKLKLKEGANKSLKLKFAYPSSLSDGDYYIITTVSTGSARDLNLANNTSASTSTVLIAKPFVKLAGGALSAPTFDGVKPVSVSFTITNNGNETASATTAVEFFASTTGTPTGATSLATTPLKLNLKPSAAHLYKFKLALPTTLPAGTYMLVALLDPANVFNDPNSAMNFIVSGNTFVVA